MTNALALGGPFGGQLTLCWRPTTLPGFPLPETFWPLPPLPEPAPAHPALAVDLGTIEQTLLDKGGSIAAAARVLGVPSADLRRLVGSRPLLADAIYEGIERALDAAEQTLLDGLDQENPIVRLKAAAYLLRMSPAGGRRGWQRRGAAHHKSIEAQAVTTRWLD